MCLDHSAPVETGIFESWLLVCTYSMISGLNQELSMLLNFFSLFSFHLECRERERTGAESFHPLVHPHLSATAQWAGLNPETQKSIRGSHMGG